MKPHAQLKSDSYNMIYNCWWFLSKCHTTTVYVQIFEGCNFRGFHGELAICKISSSKFHWQTLTCMNQRAGYLVILENKIAICDILEIYMPRKFVCIRYANVHIYIYIYIYIYMYVINFIHRLMHLTQENYHY